MFAMWNDVTDFLVVVLPTVIALLSVVVSIKLTRGESHKMWWGGIIALGLCASGLTWLSQSNARKAHAIEVKDLHGKLEYMKGQLEQENATLTTVTGGLSRQSAAEEQKPLGRVRRAVWPNSASGVVVLDLHDLRLFTLTGTTIGPLGSSGLREFFNRVKPKRRSNRAKKSGTS